jgi:hypothetical protein
MSAARSATTGEVAFVFVVRGGYLLVGLAGEEALLPFGHADGGGGDGHEGEESRGQQGYRESRPLHPFGVHHQVGQGEKSRRKK